MKIANAMRNYYYTDGQDKYGPFTFEELKTKSISEETLVWYQGLQNWVPAGKVEELHKLFYDNNISKIQGYTDIRIKNNYTGSIEVVSLDRWNEITKLYGEDAYSIIAYFDKDGYRIDDDAKKIEADRPPKSYLTEAILVTLLCCLPFGVAGIVNASKVESLYYSGDIEGAIRASKAASKWNNYGIWFGIGLAILYVFANFLIMSLSTF